jgi:hypothetical protein
LHFTAFAQFAPANLHSAANNKRLSHFVSSEWKRLIAEHVQFLLIKCIIMHTDNQLQSVNQSINHQSCCMNQFTDSHKNVNRRSENCEQMQQHKKVNVGDFEVTETH